MDDELRHLVSEASRTGRIDLCDLTHDAVEVLSDGQWLLHDMDARSNWVALPPHERTARATAALDALTLTGAVHSWTVEDGRIGTRLAAGPRLVAHARTNPTLLAFGADADGRPRGALIAPRCYGVGHGDVLDGLVVELVGPRTSTYRLLSPTYATRSLAEWLVRAVSTDDLGSRQEEASLIVLRRGAHPAGVVDRSGVTVRWGPEGLTCQPLDRADLRRPCLDGGADVDHVVAALLQVNGAGAVGRPCTG